MLSVVGIAIAFVLLIVLSFKGWSTLYTSFIVTAVVIVFSGMDFADTITNVYLPGVSSFVTGFFLVMVFGGMMGKLYDKSGAARSIAQGLTKAFLRPGMSDSKRISIAVIIAIVLGFLLAYGGINNVALLVTLYPLCVALCKEVNIPQRFAIGLAATGCNTFVYGFPGSPQGPNIAAMNALGTDSYVALVPGIIGGIVECVVIILLFTWMIKKDRAKGINFEYGPNDTALPEDQKLPNFWLSLIPLVSIFITFNFLGLNISLACAVGVLLCIIFFARNLESRSHIIPTMTDGAQAGIISCLLISAVTGFGAVVSASVGYEIMLNGLLGADMPAMVKLLIVILIFAAVAGSPTTAVNMTLPTLGPVFQSMGVSLASVHRISVYAATITDSLPCSGGVVMGVNMSGKPFKESYPPIFVATVVATACGTVAVMILCSIPGLA